MKFTLRFRGREMAHQEIGMQLLQKVRETLADKIRVEHEPSKEGRQVGDGRRRGEALAASFSISLRCD